MSIQRIVLNINGVDREILCEPEKDSLADVVRRLGLTGTKVGCGTGHCGACSLLLDGEVTRSCVKKMKQVKAYAKVETIEGIGSAERLHPLQRAFMTYASVQCGFCSPGFIMSAKGLLMRNPDPTREEVREWFTRHGNVCRCTGYKPIVDAVMEAAAVMRGEKAMEDITFTPPEGGRLYGSDFPKPTALSRVLGTCDFGADISGKMPEGTLHLAVVLAKREHARIRALDTAEAQAMPGVVNVVTAKDVKGTNRLVAPQGTVHSLCDGLDRPVICDGVKKAYGSHIVFHDVTLTINRGEKVAFVGKNGEGKSTLVKCIMDEIPYEGKLTIGHNVQIGYFAQNQAQMLDENLSVFDTIDYVAKGDIRLKIRDILGAFMFGGEASDKKVKVLSGGERSRLAMIKLLLEPVNFLILDEPTNHLDMRSKDVLKEAIKEFDGTVIVVSHDREFLDGLVTKVYEFGGGVVKEHIGGIYDFLQKKKIESLNELQLSASPTMSATKKEELETVSENKLSYEAQKELNKKIRKLEKRIADCEQKIEKLETEIGEVEADMATPEGASDMALYEKHQKLKKDLDQTVEEWETVSMELEEMQGS